MKKFEIPEFYRSNIITEIKQKRKLSDPRKQNFKPTIIDFGKVRFHLARHFGFCYGVENAIEIAYKTIDENEGKRVFLLSEMIHNPEVNEDLTGRGVKFIMDTKGNMLFDWNEITGDDIVLIPAFGTTIEIEEILKAKGIDPLKYNTTCPFVEKVWNRSQTLGEKNYTVIIHGKHYHEETRATFSHSKETAASLIVRDIKESEKLAGFILGNESEEEFYKFFAGKYSEGFDFKKDLIKIGVVNQTTMLATETEAITSLLRETMIKKYGEKNIAEHIADTRDTLCYATNDNQDSTYELLKTEADFAIVAGGYNSSNTSHIVELCEEKLTTYFISNESKLISNTEIAHYDLKNKEEIKSINYIPEKDVVNILLTCGASCPDAIVEKIMLKTAGYITGDKEYKVIY